MIPLPEDKLPFKAIPVFSSRTVMEAMQTSSVGRPRKYSDVAEEDEATGGSGSESSRRSQRYNHTAISFIFNYQEKKTK